LPVIREQSGTIGQVLADHFSDGDLAVPIRAAQARNLAALAGRFEAAARI